MVHSRTSRRRETSGKTPRVRTLPAEAPPAPTPSAATLRTWFLGVAVLAALPFLPAWRNGFVNWDDYVFIVNNPHIQSLSPRNLWAMFAGYLDGNYIPLTQLSFALNVAIHGLAPAGFHLTNILLHASNAGLAMLLLVRSRAPVPWAAAGALLFAWHPLRVESVVWATERKDVLFALFYLLSLLAYARYLEGGVRRDRRAALGWFVLSGLAKQMALSLPVVLLLLDVVAGRRRPWALLREKAPFFAVAAGLVLVAYVGQHSAASLVTGTQYTPLHRVLLSCNSLLVYLKNAFWPLNLCCIYPYPRDVVAEAAYAPMLVAALAGGVVWAGRRFPPLAAGAAFFVLTLLPVLNVVPAGAQAVADRFTYLPAIGLSFIAAQGARALAARQGRSVRTLLLAIAVVPLVFLAARSWNRTGVWRDDLALWTDAVRKAPDSYVAHSNLGLAWMQRENYADALRCFDRAVAVSPTLADGYQNRAMAHRKLNQPQAALADYTVALTLSSAAALWFFRAETYFEAGDCPRAVPDYTRALAENPGYGEALLGRGICHGMQGDYLLAIEDFSALLRENPDHLDARFNRGKAYYELARYDEALADFDHALQVDPGFAKARYHRAVVWIKRERYPDAVRDLRLVMDLGYVIEPAVMERLPPPYRLKP